MYMSFVHVVFGPAPSRLSTAAHTIVWGALSMLHSAAVWACRREGVAL
jgi:hypothetical protein